jgi:predicted house-cleaning NTP pyrophosphatase (Maf/HAM1 superfamily)
MVRKGKAVTNPSDLLRIARSYSEASNENDWDRLRFEVLAPDVEAWSQSAQFLERGPEEIIQALQKSKGSVFDTNIEVVNAVVGEDQVVLELRINGKTYGNPNDPNDAAESNGREPRAVALSTCHVYRIHDGKIVHLTTYSDRTFRFV